MSILKAALSCAALVAVPAMAQGDHPVIVEGGAPTAIVSYADLDIGSASGLSTLNRRISRAASALCVESGRKDLDRARFEARCLGTALAGARLQVERARSDRSFQIATLAAIRLAAR